MTLHRDKRHRRSTRRISEIGAGQSNHCCVLRLAIRNGSQKLFLVRRHSTSAASQDPAWVLPGDSVPSDSIRLIALGTGTPSVYKEQAS